MYEIMWKIVVQPERPQMTVRRMRIECCITNVTNTHSEYVTLVAFAQQQWLRERFSFFTFIRTLPVLLINNSK